MSGSQSFNDVKPTDWAYPALANLMERYGCVVGHPDGTFRGQRPRSRYEAAAGLNACLDRVSEITDELKRLTQEFEKELALLRGRVDGLEARVGEGDPSQFSTTTKLAGQATFVLGATSLNYDLQLTFNTSFTGKDLLRTNLRAGNFWFGQLRRGGSEHPLPAGGGV